jgi:hypothetical protein
MHAWSSRHWGHRDQEPPKHEVTKIPRHRICALPWPYPRSFANIAHCRSLNTNFLYQTRLSFGIILGEFEIAKYLRSMSNPSSQDRIPFRRSFLHWASAWSFLYLGWLIEVVLLMLWWDGIYSRQRAKQRENMRDEISGKLGFILSDC